VVLAGGEGVRLRALSQRICGDQRPKQYVPILGESTLLRQTLDRVALGIPPARTLVVTLRSHARYWAGSDGSHVLVQPSDRGTAAGILLPVHWVARRNPGATVAVFPSDHFVSEPALLMAHITRIADWVDRHPEWLVLLGARATRPEVEYGWIELGRPLDSAPDRRIWMARRFWEKPSEERAHICLQAGCLWNTFILVGKVAAFLRAGREAVPVVDDRLSWARVFFGTEDEAWALHQAYALMPRANFSRAILEACPPFLAVAAMPEGIWSDLGTPQRVFEILGALRSRPAWALTSDSAAS
jgi:mannose-1-phosphate guanylyltransferase